jgi:hypothetical protein
MPRHARNESAHIARVIPPRRRRDDDDSSSRRARVTSPSDRAIAWIAQHVAEPAQHHPPSFAAAKLRRVRVLWTFT